MTMKSIPYQWHLKQTNVCLAEKWVESRHMLIILNLKLVDKHRCEHIRMDELKEEPMAMIRAKLQNKVFRLWEIMFRVTSTGHTVRNTAIWVGNVLIGNHHKTPAGVLFASENLAMN